MRRADRNSMGRISGILANLAVLAGCRLPRLASGVTLEPAVSARRTAPMHPSFG